MLLLHVALSVDRGDSCCIEGVGVSDKLDERTLLDITIWTPLDSRRRHQGYTFLIHHIDRPRLGINRGEIQNICTFPVLQMQYISRDL